MTKSNPPDARTVVPGQTVTYHQTESRPGVKVAWSGHEHFVIDSPAPLKVVQPAQPGTNAWRNAAIHAVLIEQGIVGRAQLSEAEFDKLVNGLMMRLDDPAGNNDAERRIVGLEYQVTELRGNRDVHAKVIAELSNRAEALESTVKALADVLTSVQERARAQDERIRELRAHAIPDTTDLPAMPSAQPAPDEALRAAQGRCLADGCPGTLHVVSTGAHRCVECGKYWPSEYVAKLAAVAPPDCPLQPGDIWRDPQGTEYLVVTALEAVGKPRCRYRCSTAGCWGHPRIWG